MIKNTSLKTKKPCELLDNILIGLAVAEMTAGIEIIKDNFAPWSKIAVRHLLFTWLKIRLKKLIKIFDDL